MTNDINPAGINDLLGDSTPPINYCGGQET